MATGAWGWRAHGAGGEVWARVAGGAHGAEAGPVGQGIGNDARCGVWPGGYWDVSGAGRIWGGWPHGGAATTGPDATPPQLSVKTWGGGGGGGSERSWGGGGSAGGCVGVEVGWRVWGVPPWGGGVPRWGGLCVTHHYHLQAGCVSGALGVRRYVRSAFSSWEREGERRKKERTTSPPLFAPKNCGTAYVYHSHVLECLTAAGGSQGPNRNGTPPHAPPQTGVTSPFPRPLLASVSSGRCALAAPRRV